jgi:ABC-2 type transport system ATP-binding protein
MAILHGGRVLFEGTPEEAIAGLRSRVWQRFIAKTEAPDYVQRFRIISNRLVGGRPFLHVLCEEPPGDGFAAGAPDLEDVFFTRIRGWN